MTAELISQSKIAIPPDLAYIGYYLGPCSAAYIRDVIYYPFERPKVFISENNRPFMHLVTYSSDSKQHLGEILARISARLGYNLTT